jgi:hypothetical protein
MRKRHYATVPWVLLAAALGTGCMPRVVPSPHVETREGRECVASCRNNHAECIGGGRSSSQGSTLQEFAGSMISLEWLHASSCSDGLAACYAGCRDTSPSWRPSERQSGLDDAAHLASDDVEIGDEP